ncbi:MAG TPA: tripartite tricarboxylate transporter substrate-binding protein, partial [Burkholderiales bacterium]|nr:tripartite tricarboxylate transporter substrate-binding protein [Burkholderiales bacterium]
MRFDLRPRRYATRGALVLLAACALPVTAQNYPLKPIKIIMPFPPGGTNDLVARAVGDRLAGVFKQPVVVDNRAGAGGLIGTDAVAKSPPDGYTLLVGNAGSLAAGLSLRSKIPYDVMRD